MITFGQANDSDIPSIAALLSHGVSRKKLYNDNSWGDDPFSEAEVRDILENSKLYLAHVDDEVAGVLAVTQADPLWEDQPGANAYYIHRMTTDKRFRGQNIGGQLLDWLVSTANNMSVNVLRLDCDCNNRQLCDYYKAQGFSEVARKDLHNRVTGQIDTKALFEKKKIGRAHV